MNENLSLYNQVKQEIERLQFNVVNFDFDRPWGGFLVIDEGQLQLFISTFFNEIDINLSKNIKLSPKILIINPKSRLSWQYHLRRKEIWSVYKGPVGVIKSMDDIEKPMRIFQSSDIITFDIQERHRLIGLEDFGIVAEIWQHIDINNPSNEDDIVRLQDDYKRN